MLPHRNLLLAYRDANDTDASRAQAAFYLMAELNDSVSSSTYPNGLEVGEIVS
jgi:hypothetical protein